MHVRGKRQKERDMYAIPTDRARGVDGDRNGSKMHGLLIGVG